MAKAKAATTTTPVTAKTIIVYDGDRYDVGDALDVRPEDLDQLLSVSAVEVVAVEQAPAA
jgi:hypothetical protein